MFRAAPGRGLANRNAAELYQRPVIFRPLSWRGARSAPWQSSFLATWCVPCREELPTIKAVYQKYHDRGFEIIGITDDIVPKDPRNPRGSEKSLAQLQAFFVKENMPWPQL
ncbi:MAG: TlpA family protein disulfide reductase, partial [Opitutus sp.]|nr:TlpA family protein disulfide reductase [Opitutus sp.]